jgi:predicted amidophosphoribosyltransferase
MFIEVSDFKGLIVNLNSFNPSTDHHWYEISKLVPILFICDDDERIFSLNSSLQDSVIFMKSKMGKFFYQLSIIREAMKKLGLQPYEVAFVSADPQEMEIILQEPIGSVLVNSSIEIGYEFIGHLPDFIVGNIAEIIDICNGKRKGFFAEVNSTLIRNRPLSTTGQVLFSSLNSSSYQFKLISMGRYYGPNHHRHNLHQFSLRLLKSKNDDSQLPTLSGLFSPIVDYINEKMAKVDGITRVPPRPNQRDRLNSIVEVTCAKDKYTNHSHSLICVEPYPSQKGLNSEARMLNVQNKFRALNDIYGKHIVLLDDIITTGSTTSECALTLIRAGAKEVTIVVFGVNQKEPIFNFRQNNILPCPDEQCDGFMKLKLRNDGSSAFYGCTNFRETSCKQSMHFLDGWQAINKLNKIEEIEDSLTF